MNLANSKTPCPDAANTIDVVSIPNNAVVHQTGQINGESLAKLLAKDL